MTEQELNTAVDTYLANHLDKTYWQGLSAENKANAKAMARNDIEAIVGEIKLDKITATTFIGKNLVAGCAEQALYLSRNYAGNTENKVTTSESVGGVSVGYTVIGDVQVGSRACIYINNLKRYFGTFSVRLTRG